MVVRPSARQATGWLPELLGQGAGAELVETHISWVVLSGERVHKLKKPVDLGFVDYTERERRRHFCELEVALNRRLAPGVYLGVVALVRRSDGRLDWVPAEQWDARPAADAELLEWAVEMQRLPAERMLDRLLERGEVDNRLMDALAHTLAGFHRDAATGPSVDPHGSLSALSARLAADFDDLADFVGEGAEATLSPALCEHLRRGLGAELERCAARLERRVAEGRVRDGHGDLHAGNICIVDGRPVIYDCIEFDPALRCGDVASDLAFLAMDLDRQGFRGFSRYLVRRYAEAAQDPELPGLMTLFKTQRALVRGKVASIRAGDTGLPAPEREASRAAARHAFQLAAGYLAPPLLMLTCGLPASGKSWLARQLAEPFGALVLRSDVRRKTLAGLPPNRPAGAAWGQGLYAPEAVEHTYQVLLDEALTALEQGRSVVVDASFSRAHRRQRFVDAAVRSGIPVALVWLRCPEDVIRERLAQRARQPGEASDADWEVYTSAREAFESPAELHASMLVEVDQDTSPGAAVAAVLERCLGQLARPMPYDVPQEES